MPETWLEFLGVQEFDRAVEAMVGRMNAGTRRGTVAAASELERRAKENSSGRPGPNVVSGTHRRGIVQDPVTPYGVGGWQTQVGPTVIYSRRLELGWWGGDEYPYFEPAFKATDFAGIYHKQWAASITG